MAEPDGGEVVEGLVEPGGSGGGASPGPGSEGYQPGFDVVVSSFAGPDFLGGAGGEDLAVGQDGLMFG